MLFACAVFVATLIPACGGAGGGTGLTDVLIVGRNEGLAELDLASNDEELLIAVPEQSLLIEPAISPDRSTLAYVRQLIPIVVPGEQVELGMDLYLANRDGSDSRILLEHSEPNEQIRSPVWFPDGQRMLINVQGFVDAQIVTTIEVLDVATGERRQIVQDGFRPAVSPDGTRIAYVTQEIQDINIFQRLWVANADGSDPVELVGPEDDIGSVISPVFSPDGQTIAFAGSNLLAATVSHDEQTYVSIAPVARLSASAFNGLPADIWTIPVDGGEPRHLAPLQLDLPSLDWSADGERLFAFAGLGLYVIDPTDGSEERLGDGTFHGQVDWVSAEEPTER